MSYKANNRKLNKLVVLIFYTIPLSYKKIRRDCCLLLNHDIDCQLNSSLQVDKKYSYL